jgi:hypothetical protein
MRVASSLHPGLWVANLPDNRRFMQPTPDSRTKQLQLAELNVKRTSTIAARGHCILAALSWRESRR